MSSQPTCTRKPIDTRYVSRSANLLDTLIVLNGIVEIDQRRDCARLHYRYGSITTSKVFDAIHRLPASQDEKLQFATNNAFADRSTDKAGHLPKVRGDMIAKMLPDYA
jgi:hypothetical protein